MFQTNVKNNIVSDVNAAQRSNNLLSSAYCATARSDENLPILAVVSIDLMIHSGWFFMNISSQSRSASRYESKSLETSQ